MDRRALIESLTQLVSDWGAGTPGDIRELLEPLLGGCSDVDLDRLIERTRSSGGDWTYFPPDPVARAISRQMMQRVVVASSTLEGDHWLGQLRDRRVLLLGNHLSYVDVNVFDYLCHRAGHSGFADRLTAIVGPKVYMAPIRLLASLCFGTIKTPQSSSIASGEAVMSPREVARLARHTLAVARDRVERGDRLVLFPEGARSRSGALQPALPAAARYLEIPDLWIVPFALTGCEKLVPLEEDHAYPNAVHARIGAPIEASRLLALTPKNRGCATDALGFCVAELLPEAYRGYYATPVGPGLERSREVATALLEQTPA